MVDEQPAGATCKSPNCICSSTSCPLPQIIVERAKWQSCWEEIQYCSDRCRSEGKRAKRAAQEGAPAAATQ